MNRLKKTVVAVMAVSMVFTTLAPAMTNAQTTSDELAEIQQIADSLGIDISVLLESMGIDAEDDETIYQEISIDGIPAGFRFNENLRLGVRGSSVRYLQILLNTDPQTRVSTSGAGSPGNETEFFGPRTEAAVIRFQEKYSGQVLAPFNLTSGTGFVGTTTRAKLNQLLSEEVATPTDPTTPDGMTAVLEQLQQLAEALRRLQARLDEIEDGVTVPVDAEEGILTFRLLTRPRNEELGSGRSRAVAGFELEAEDSAMTVQRINVRFKEIGQSPDYTRTDLDRWIESLALEVDGEIVAERSVTRTTLDRDDLQITFSGMSLEIPRDDRVEVRVVVRTENFNINENKTVYLSIPNEGIRAVDEANFREIIDGGNLRSFRLLADDMAVINAELSSDSPEEGIVILDKDDFTNNILLTVMDLEVEDGDIKIEDLYARLDFKNIIDGEFEDLYYEGYTTNQNNFGTFFNDYIDEVILYHGGDEIDAVVVRNALRYYYDGREVFRVGTNDWEYDDGSDADINDSAVVTVMTAEEIVFEVDMDIDADTISEFELRVNARDLDPAEKDQGLEIVGTFVKMFGLDYITDEDIESYLDVEGKNQKLVSHYIEVSDISTSINRSTWSDGNRDRAEGYLRFNITALGGDIFIDNNEDALESDSFSFASGDGLFDLQWADMSISGNYTETGNSFRINEGRTARIQIDFATEEDIKRAKVKLGSLTWGVERDDFDTTITYTDSMIENLETRRVELFQVSGN